MQVVERVAQVLGGRAVLHRNVRTWEDLDRAVRAGLPKRSLQLVARSAVGPGASVNAFVYRVVPPATFKRRVDGKACLARAARCSLNRDFSTNEELAYVKPPPSGICASVTSTSVAVVSPVLRTSIV